MSDPWNEPLEATALAFVDLEMTGCDPAVDRICEVAVHRVRGQCLERRLVTLVKPDRSVGDSVRIHGIDDAALADAPTLRPLRDPLRELFRDAIIVGHAIHFDLAFLAAAAERGELDAPPTRALDTRLLAQRALRVGSSALAVLAEDLGLPRPTHRAEADVETTRALFSRVCAALRPTTAEHLAIAQGIGGPAQMRQDIETTMRACWDANEAIRVCYRVPGREPFVDEIDLWAFEPPRVEGWLRDKGAIRALRGDRLLWVERTGSPRIHRPPDGYVPTIPSTSSGEGQASHDGPIGHG